MVKFPWLKNDLTWKEMCKKDSELEKELDHIMDKGHGILSKVRYPLYQFFEDTILRAKEIKDPFVRLEICHKVMDLNNDVGVMP